MILNELLPTSTLQEDIDFFGKMQHNSDELRRDIKKIQNTINSFQERFDKEK